jgi:3-oxoacyl-[acyl-carrier protein] reductase
MRLDNRVAVVTGAARGIGRAIARQLGESGATVVIADIDRDGAETAAKELELAGHRAIGYYMDVSNSEHVSAVMASIIHSLGRVDVLVNNAGIVGDEYPVHKLSDAQWHRMMDVNLHGVFYCSRAVVPTMLTHQWGRIVNISSVSGKEGVPNIADYCAAKAGVIGFTKCLAKEVAREGITVNCVTPGLTDDTEMARGFTPSQRATKVAKVPMGRMATTNEVAAVAVFLASEEASFVTGAIYDVTGGRSDY